MKMSKEVTVKQATAVALPAIDMSADAGIGFNNIRPEDVAIPFMAILQSNSPQVRKGPTQIAGATEGDIYNTVTQKIYNGAKGVLVVPCAYEKAYVEWGDRDNGGGFVKKHTDEAILAQCSKGGPNGTKDILSNGNYIATTNYHYAIVLEEDGTLSRVVIGMTSTQLKRSRRWLGQMLGIQIKRADGSLFTPPMFSHSYRLSTCVETKDSKSWMNWQIDNPTLLSDANVYTFAKDFAKMVSAGSVKTAEPAPEEESNSVDVSKFM
jgi:hypothetical protein